MTTEAVAADLTALDPGAFLVPERIVRRVIRHERKIRGIGLLVPHGRCHVASAETVQEVVRPFELHLADGLAGASEKHIKDRQRTVKFPSLELGSHLAGDERDSLFIDKLAQDLRS